jgi:hypothetical protein
MVFGLDLFNDYFFKLFYIELFESFLECLGLKKLGGDCDRRRWYLGETSLLNWNIGL